MSTIELSSTALAERVIQTVQRSVPRAFSARPVTPDTDLKSDLALDSLGLMTLAFRLEDELTLELSPHVDALRSVVTVADLIGLVERLRTADVAG